MSWHFSQALVEEYLAGNSSAGAPSAPSSGTPTHGTFWSPGKTTDALKPSRSGMTFKPSTESHGEAVLMWCLAASRARIFHAPEKVQASKATEAPCGNTWHESSVKYCRNTSSWKTHRCLWEEALPSSSLIFPKWGMMRSGVLWERTTPEHLTSGTESGSWPTPAARDCKGANSREHCETNGTGRKHMDQLANAVAHPDLRFATPQARDFRTGSTERWDNPERSRNLNDQIGGQLNPTWVEWLMGWPLGWTDCAVSATDKFRQWLNSHGKH